LTKPPRSQGVDKIAKNTNDDCPAESVGNAKRNDASDTVLETAENEK